MNASGADRGEDDVAPRLVRLRFDREPDRITLVDDVLGEEVDAFPVAIERCPHVLGGVGLRALASPQNT